MEKPIYRLEGVVKKGVEATTDFVGPLDLILHLLQKNRIEIQDIPIAGILEQYLAWVEGRHRLDLDVASEFITMAAHLMYIKSRMLLSQQDEEALSEIELLIANLEEHRRNTTYAAIQQVQPQLEAQYRMGSGCCEKQPEAATTGRVYRYAHRKEELQRALTALRARRGRSLPPDLSGFQTIVRQERYPVGRKTTQLVKRLLTVGRIKLSALLSGSRSRSELTAAFLALLELCRAGKIRVSGSMRDPEIWKAEAVAKRGEAPEDNEGAQ